MQTVDILLQKSCRTFAARTAVAAGRDSITYAELLSRGRSVADALRAEGLGAGSAVGVLGRRGPAAVIAVLGVWLAGAAVVLIDEALPEKRREAMLDCGPVGAVIVCSDNFRIELRNATARLDDPDQAYIAFTSGSTGRPKAIVGSHRGLSHFLRWQSGEFAVGPDDRFAHFTNLSFDVWFRDALTPLISGATLCVPAEQHLDPAGVRQFLRAEKITGLHLVPSLGKLWTADSGDDGGTDLRVAFFAGEPLDSGLVGRWRELFPRCEVVNLYGPTETTLAQHFYRVRSEPAPGVQPVGRPIPGSASHVLDEQSRVCAPGEVGQIHIAARHPSHGYLVDGRIVAPFVTITVDGRPVVAYPTGDLGRAVPGPEHLEIAGRADEQIKIAGVRIELQEVRAAIQAHDSVRDAFVCALPDRFTKVIVAVVDGDAEAEQRLRDHLAERLIGVMVPAAFCYLPRLPKLPNGKADRTALTAAARDHLDEQARRTAAARAASTGGEPVADRLERIWLAVAGGAGPRLADRDRNFFEVGGTSLSIITLHAEIQDEFGVRFPLVRLFEHASFDAQRRFLESVRKPRDVVPRSAAAAAGAATRNRVLAARRSRRPDRMGNR